MVIPSSTVLGTVAIFSAQYPPHVGGIESFSDRLAHALANKGYVVFVITNDISGQSGIEIESGVTVIRLPCHPLMGGRLPLPRLSNARKRLIDFLKSTNFDACLINARFFPHSLLGMKIARQQGLTPIVLDHGSAYLTLGNNLLDFCLRAYEHVITGYGKRYECAYYGISEKSSEWLRHFGITPNGVIPNAIDAREYCNLRSGRNFRSELGLSDSIPLVAYVGRLIPEKGIAILLDAAKSIETSSSSIHFVIAGDGPLKEEVRGAGDNVHYVGKLNQPDVAELLCEADCLCLPSRSEGFATCLLEAAACGTPAITTDVGGAREVILDESYGIILEELSEDSLLTSFLRLASDRDGFLEMGKRCRQWVESHYSWNDTALAFECACGLNSDSEV